MIIKTQSAAFEDLMAYVERINKLNGGSACALFVIQHDKVLAEYYSGTHSFELSSKLTEASSQFNVASVRKSYIGFAVAWAMHNGYISSFDDPVLRYYPYNEELISLFEGVTMRHFLTHTHGLAEVEGSIIRRFQPGTNWAYNNVGIKQLANLIPHITGMTVAQILEESIFNPLGWKETGWRTTFYEELVPSIADDESGIDLCIGEKSDGTDSNLFVSARELAYWGYLHLNLGKINGKSVFSESLFRTIVTSQSPSSLPKELPHNGCLWLVKQSESPQCLMGSEVPLDSFEIVGITGPLVFIVPKLDLVVIRMANRIGNYEDENGSHIQYLKEFTNLAISAALRH